MPNRFRSNPSLDFDAAVAALMKLSWEDQTRAFATVASPELETRVEGEIGKKEKKSSWRRLVDQKPRDEDQLPADDHAELRLGKGGVYTSHPYHLDLNELREIVSVCEEHGLNVEIDAQSWYFPSRTIRVSYRPKKSN